MSTAALLTSVEASATKHERNAIIRTLAGDRRYTLTEIAGMFGISRQRVEQLYRHVRHDARQAVTAALASGEMERPNRCSGCLKRKDRIEAHHDNYNSPLDVRWLCPACHKTADRDKRTHAAVQQRHGAMEAWKCWECGAERIVRRSRKHSRFCDQACAKAWRAKQEPDRRRHPDGHWWLADPATGKTMRVERYIAQKRLGRPLGRREWVRLVDGNPDNLTDENIVVCSPKEVMATRVYSGHHGAGRRERWTRDAIVSAVLDFRSAKGRLPNWGEFGKGGPLPAAGTVYKKFDRLRDLWVAVIGANADKTAA